MARPLKTYPAWQLVLILSAYIIFFILFAFIYLYILRYYGLETLKDADPAQPGVKVAWKLVTILDAVFSNLLPAVLFTWMISARTLGWLHLDQVIRWKQALFVAVLVLLAVPVAGVLYDWNCTLGFAKGSLMQTEEMLVMVRVMEDMPHVGYLFFNLIFLVLLPAIARECFFRGVIQRVLVNMWPGVPWLAIVITAALFAGSFFQWQYLFSAMLWGVLLGTIYYLTDNLWLSILGHFIYRGNDQVQLFFYQQQWINEDPYQPSPTPWYLGLICLLCMIGLVWYFRKSIPRPVVKVAYQDDIDFIGRS